jgi:hypothetical protein
MWILLLEGGLALFLLLFIVWWTMFHGRDPEGREHDEAAARKENDTPGS